jgi:hypothetical protein
LLYFWSAVGIAGFIALILLIAIIVSIVKCCQACRNRNKVEDISHMKVDVTDGGKSGTQRYEMAGINSAK